MGIIIGDYIGTTTGDPFPHSLLRTRESLKASVVVSDPA